MRVRLPVGDPRKAVLVPEQALGTDQGRKYLYVVNDKDEVAYRLVTTGLMNQGMRVIEEGLKPGERFIVSGQQRVQPGAKVDPKPADDPMNPMGPATVAAEATPEGPPRRSPAGE